MGRPKENLSYREANALFRFADGVRMFIDRALADELEIDSIDARILMYVAQRGELDQRCIATDIWKGLCIPKSTALNKLKALKQTHIAERRYVHELRGQKNLVLTGSGATLLKKAVDVWVRATASAARVVCNEDLARIGECMESLEPALPKLVMLYHEEDNADWDFKKSSVLVRSK